ncbi:glycosyltransferase family 2 protein [Neobacillus fumarioli]|uniref:glycosyltransferase family 2 protein n=1 Tax=Neobacillus fumarioli TaxID=105229 RepID=UPI0008339164|nr:glycosyltransferase family 2 protein [Neobacillus fumarioli]
MRDVGVVMPVYNQDPNYLREACLSILQQTYQDFHFVIVIDGADQPTRKVINELLTNDERVTIIDKEKNEGVCKALNAGFQYLFTLEEVQYLTWVSSDNIYYPHFVEVLRDHMMSSPYNVGLVFSSFRHISPDGIPKQTEKDLENFRVFQNKKKEELLDVCFIGVSFMYKKKYAIQIDGYHFVPVEDYEYWLRLTEICDISYVPQELMDYRENAPTSISYDLHTNLLKHRWWRDRFNLARQLARKRLNIPFETSILFPIEQTSEQTITKLEEMLDQTYHCYQFIILDSTHQFQNTLHALNIHDPRIVIIPTENLETELKMQIYSVTTPYVMMINENPFPNSIYALETLVKTLKNINSPLMSSYFENHLLQLRNNDAIHQLKCNELYPTPIRKRLYQRD